MTTRTIYQVQGKEYATEPEARAHLVSILGFPVHSVDWLDVTSFHDGANGIRRYIAGVVNEQIEPDGISDLDEYLKRYRQPRTPPSKPETPENPVQSADDVQSDEA